MDIPNHEDVARLYDEQKPDPTAPCPLCGEPVREDKNISVENGKLIARCGGSGYDYSGGGCFAKVAWNPETTKWDVA